MLRRISESLALSEASLLALRPALNAPVLNVDFLPVGPARAAIVVFAEEYGGIGLALGIRSTERGQVAVFRNREPIEETSPIDELVESALESAERMGFLFDDDMVRGTSGAQGRSEATALWGRLMGDVAMPPPPKTAPSRPAAAEPILDLTETMEAPAEVAELVLETVAGDTGAASSADGPTARAETNPKALSNPTPTPEVPAEVPEATTLSKFRQAPQATVDPVPDPGSMTSSNLGRVPVVKRRRAGSGIRRIPYLARLLSSF